LEVTLCFQKAKNLFSEIFEKDGKPTRRRPHILRKSSDLSRFFFLFFSLWLDSYDTIIPFFEFDGFELVLKTLEAQKTSNLQGVPYGKIM
jgi:hypothetical protein